MDTSFFDASDVKQGEDIFNTIFTLEDKEFNVVAPVFLMELSRTLDRDKGIQQELIAEWDKEMQEKGLSYEEYRERGLVELDEALKDMSEPKRDFMKKFQSMLCNFYEEAKARENHSVTIPIEIGEGAVLPKYANETDAGCDVYLTEDVTLGPGERKVINLHFRTAIPAGYAILMQPRSGLSAKSALRIANTPGLIDAGYRDDYKVILENIESPIQEIDYDFDEDGHPVIKSILHGQSYTLTKGDRIAQLRLVKAPQINWQVVSSVKDYGEDRGGGLGHTGTK